MTSTRADNVKIVETVLKPYKPSWLSVVMYLSRKKTNNNNVKSNDCSILS